jgi:hypothetical protein
MDSSFEFFPSSKMAFASGLPITAIALLLQGGFHLFLKIDHRLQGSMAE